MRRWEFFYMSPCGRTDTILWDEERVGRAPGDFDVPEELPCVCGINKQLMRVRRPDGRTEAR